jgi:hypothetical protein
VQRIERIWRELARFAVALHLQSGAASEHNLEQQDAMEGRHGPGEGGVLHFSPELGFLGNLMQTAQDLQGPTPEATPNAALYARAPFSHHVPHPDQQALGGTVSHPTVGRVHNQKAGLGMSAGLPIQAAAQPGGPPRMPSQNDQGI